MDFFRAGKMRWLYLLALAQLVGGPLVLLQVTVFTKLTLQETPRMGVAKAAVHAWHSGDFQTVLSAADVARKNDSKAPAPVDGPQPKLEKAKLPVVPWMSAPVSLACLSSHCSIVDHARVWTPAWPQAPPGPPPRIG
ncbi:MAG: hypothetical protein EOP88_14690 [Verrucomicrobiaceae bacterium]|nr:MAG: hypothetical protein EOP88_14690 [Verrucomicrobiaceae bacterium]